MARGLNQYSDILIKGFEHYISFGTGLETESGRGVYQYIDLQSSAVIGAVFSEGLDGKR